MIDVELALQLKDAGLVWRMQNHDFFTIPDRNLDNRVFVLSDMMAYMDLIKGWPVVSFHGSSEWALDYILSHEVVWLPTETQVREELVAMLARDVAHPSLQLKLQDGDYVCEIMLNGRLLSATGHNPSDAYGRLLLHVLQQLPENLPG